jgi:hypothetical protein
MPGEQQIPPRDPSGTQTPRVGLEAASLGMTT